MKHLAGTISAVVLLLAAVASAAAQPHARRSRSGSLVASIDPEGDEAYFELLRERMDSIRAVEHRATVALVLSGGGAKGAAHVGAIRFLEEIGMPVDMVMGTSMGGLVGGLYAMGYDSQHLDSLLRAMDWSQILSDKVPRKYLSYNNIRYKEKYMLSIPIGATARRQKKESEAPTGVAATLPAGYINGQNVQNVLSSLSVGYQDSISFDRLPIPFLCVAADMVSVKAKNWHSGQLRSAMRSTMSIPGLFTPVRTDSLVLVDGGVRNNYPVDLARRAGADYVIGVELSDAEPGYEDVNNLLDIFWQAVDMLGRTSFEANKNAADVKVKPDLEGYTMLSFDPESISDIISRGYNEARRKTDALKALQKEIGMAENSGPRPRLQASPATDISRRKVGVHEIHINGLSEKQEQFFLKRTGLESGGTYGKDDIETAVSMLYGSGSFKNVTYSLLGTGEPYDLVLDCEYKPEDRIGIGMRFDTETLVSAIVNFGLNSFNTAGGTFDATARIGSNPYANLHYMSNNSGGFTFNAEADFTFNDLKLYSAGTTAFNIGYWRLRQQLYASSIRWSKFDAKAGFRNEYVKVNNLIGDYLIPRGHDRSKPSADYVSAFVNLANDDLDDSYYPTCGHRVQLDINAVASALSSEKERILTLQASFKNVTPIGEKFSFIQYLDARAIFGKSVPLIYFNTIGGNMAARYVDQQIPFMGLNYMTPVEDMVAVGRLDFRFSPAKKHFISATANVLATSNSLYEIDLKNGYLHQGYGLEYGYRSIVGPLSINIHWSDITNKPGFFIRAGFDF